MTSWLINGRPRQFAVMWLNMRRRQARVEFGQPLASAAFLAQPRRHPRILLARRPLHPSKMAVAVTFAMAAGGAFAQQCVGFGDVLQSDGVCPSIEWIKAAGGAPTGPTPTSVAARGTAPATGWDTVALTEVTSSRQHTYVFFVGVRPDQLSGQGGTANRIRCQVSVTVMNRNGTVSPF